MNELESRIRKANLKYRKEQKALIRKIEVPIRMTKLGMVAGLSTVDFEGVYLYNKDVGRAIAFDAKETISSTSFPLKNIHQHQLEYLRFWIKMGGEGFFFIHFKNVHPDKAFVTPIELVHKYWSDPNARKSIPISDFQDGWLVEIENYLSYFTDDNRHRQNKRKKRSSTS